MPNSLRWETSHEMRPWRLHGPRDLQFEILSSFQQWFALKMATMIRIKKGLDIPISGTPVQEISQGAGSRRVAFVAADYVGLRPALAVRDGDRVRLGQTLVTEKSSPQIRFTAPAAGTIRAVNRGAKRKLISIEIDLYGDEEERFPTYGTSSLTPDQARENLTLSGLWTALRTRPFNKVPVPDSAAHSIFVTAMDTNPLAADPAVVLAEQGEDFVLGLHVLTRLTEGTVYVCHEAQREVPGGGVPGVTMAGFAGPHPAGLPGTHIHFLDPVNAERKVWFIGYQDVVTFGTLMRTGRIRTERVVSLAGPGVVKPRLVRTRLGACLDDLTEGSLSDGEQRIISGSLLSGRQSASPANYLGRYHTQVCVIPEGRKRELFGWQAPGFDKYSARPIARPPAPANNSNTLYCFKGSSKLSVVSSISSSNNPIKESISDFL